MTGHRISLMLASIQLLVTLLVADRACAAEKTGRRSNSANQIKIMDVALHTGGVLTGQVVDATGAPIANSIVQLKGRSKALATARSDKQGKFGFHALRGGVYQVQANSGQQLVRLWANGTAPPSAKPSVTIVKQQSVVRGQGPMGPEYPFVLTPSDLILLGVVGAGIGISVAVKEPASP